MKRFLILILLIPVIYGLYSSCIGNKQQWCGCGYNREALGPCVGGECPDGYMCICDYCCEGCRDDCYDCALFSQYCDNPNYCELRQKCMKTCEICNDEDGGDDGGDDGDDTTR